ncbi:MAG: hypothetical protein ACE5GS_16965 [Kiloniellaceae bacterium]
MTLSEAEWQRLSNAEWERITKRKPSGSFNPELVRYWKRLDDVYAFLAQALLYCLPPSLRSVSFEISEDRRLRVHAILFEAAPRMELEAVEEFRCRLASTLGERLHFQIETIPSGQRVPIERVLKWSLYFAPHPEL